MPDTLRKAQLPIRFSVPEGMELGVYANIVQVRASQWDFVLTFCQLVPPGQDDAPDIEARAVARVTIPADLIDSVLRALSTSRDERERQIGGAEDEGSHND